MLRALFALAVCWALTFAIGDRNETNTNGTGKFSKLLAKQNLTDKDGESGKEDGASALAAVSSVDAGSAVSGKADSKVGSDKETTTTVALLQAAKPVMDALLLRAVEEKGDDHINTALLQHPSTAAAEAVPKAAEALKEALLERVAKEHGVAAKEILDRLMINTGEDPKQKGDETEMTPEKTPDALPQHSSAAEVESLHQHPNAAEAEVLLKAAEPLKAALERTSLGNEKGTNDHANANESAALAQTGGYNHRKPKMPKEREGRSMHIANFGDKE